MSKIIKFRATEEDQKLISKLQKKLHNIPVAQVIRRGLAALAISLGFMFIIGCGQRGIVPSAKAASPAAAPYAGCSDATGKFGTAKEFPGSQIAILDYACSLQAAQPIATLGQTLDSCGHDQVVSLVTTADFHVHAIRLWIGADMNAFFESGSCLEIIGPTGTPIKTFTAEWDKHVEEHYPDIPFPVDFIIPAGSTIRLSRDPHGTIKCIDVGVNGPVGCLTQESATLY